MRTSPHKFLNAQSEIICTFDVISKLNDGTSSTPNIPQLTWMETKHTESTFPRDKRTFTVVTKQCRRECGAKLMNCTFQLSTQAQGHHQHIPKKPQTTCLAQVGAWGASAEPLFKLIGLVLQLLCVQSNNTMPSSALLICLAIMVPSTNYAVIAHFYDEKFTFFFFLLSSWE